MGSTYNKKARTYNKKAHPPCLGGVKWVFLTLLEGVKTTYNNYSLNSYYIVQNRGKTICKEKFKQIGGFSVGVAC